MITTASPSLSWGFSLNRTPQRHLAASAAPANSQIRRNRLNPPIHSPDHGLRCNQSRREKMRIRQPNPPAVQRVRFNHPPHLAKLRDRYLWQPLQVAQRSPPVTQGTQRKFGHNERVHRDVRLSQLFPELTMSRTKVIDPDARIRQNHRSSARSRGTSANSGILPPRAASRRADSRAIKDFSPSRTRAVRSEIPVSSCASAIKSSSKAKVVLMHEL